MLSLSLHTRRTTPLLSCLRLFAASAAGTDASLLTDTRICRAPLPAEYFADAAVADAELPGDVTRPDPLVGELHDPLANDIWERAAVHKNTPQLVHASMSWNTQGRGRRAGEELCESFRRSAGQNLHPQRSPPPGAASQPRPGVPGDLPAAGTPAGREDPGKTRGPSAVSSTPVASLPPPEVARAKSRAGPALSRGAEDAPASGESGWVTAQPTYCLCLSTGR